ncbi:MAG: hypothetical protein ACRYF2_19055 [Janthinobacterium lividum]
MADTIRRRMHRADPFLDNALEPALDRWRRLLGDAVGKPQLVPTEADRAELELAHQLLVPLRLTQQIAV